MNRSTPPPSFGPQSPGQRIAVESWWRGLSASQKTDMVEFWRRDTRSAPGDWEGVTVRLVGRVEDPAPQIDDESGARDLLEFILNHEEVRFFMADTEFFICRAHEQARRILRRGELPAGFRCSLRGDACPWAAVSRAVGRAGVRVRLALERDRMGSPRDESTASVEASSSRASRHI